jgi:hypothetical protein
LEPIFSRIKINKNPKIISAIANKICGFPSNENGETHSSFRGTLIPFEFSL